MSRRSSIDDLGRLILSFHSLIAIETVEEDRVRSMLAEVARTLSLPLFEWSITSGLKRSFGISFEGTADPLSVLKHIESNHQGEAIYLLKDFAPHVDQAATARALRELAMSLMSSRSAVVITGDPINLPRDVDSIAIHFDLQLPDPQEIREMVRSVVDSISSRQRIRVELTRDEAQDLVRALSGLSLGQVRQVIAQAIVEDSRLAAHDIEAVNRFKGEIIERGGILEFYPPANNAFELGGFGRLKEWLENAKIGFTPEARALNLAPPKGVLFVGVQGCGKSLAAKFIARQWKLPLLKLDAGRLYDKFVGESEKNFRKATTVAEAMAPAILWIDEIEKMFPVQGGSDTDGGLSQRLFGSILTWLQEKRSEVFIVGAANDLARLPPELLRKGRFDEIFFVDLPRAGERKSVFEIHLMLRKQDPKTFDLDALAGATEGFSGAEIEQALIAALYRSLHRKEPLTTASILDSIRSTVPLSVSRREDVDEVRAAGARFTPVA